MKQVWKYELQPGTFGIEMPSGAQILTAQMQGDTPVLWALVDPDAALVKQRFCIVGTGTDINADAGWRYVATFQMEYSALVWHLFESVAN